MQGRMHGHMRGGAQDRARRRRRGHAWTQRAPAPPAACSPECCPCFPPPPPCAPGGVHALRAGQPRAAARQHSKCRGRVPACAAGARPAGPAGDPANARGRAMRVLHPRRLPAPSFGVCPRAFPRRLHRRYRGPTTPTRPRCWASWCPSCVAPTRRRTRCPLRSAASRSSARCGGVAAGWPPRLLPSASCTSPPRAAASTLRRAQRQALSPRRPSAGRASRAAPLHAVSSQTATRPVPLPP